MDAVYLVRMLVPDWYSQFVFAPPLLGRYGVALVVVGVAAARLLRQADVIEIRCAAVARKAGAYRAIYSC